MTASRWLVGGLSGQPSSVHVRTSAVDAGIDAGTDAGVDAGTDAGVDAGADDAGVDAGTDDSGVDAGPDDAGVDAGADDAGVDLGLDSDGGVDGGRSRLSLQVGCGCSTGTSTPDVWWLLAVALLMLARWGRPSRIAPSSAFDENRSRA